MTATPHSTGSLSLAPVFVRIAEPIGEQTSTWNIKRLAYSYFSPTGTNRLFVFQSLRPSHRSAPELSQDYWTTYTSLPICVLVSFGWTLGTNGNFFFLLMITNDSNQPSNFILGLAGNCFVDALTQRSGLQCRTTTCTKDAPGKALQDNACRCQTVHIWKFMPGSKVIGFRPQFGFPCVFCKILLECVPKDSIRLQNPLRSQRRIIMVRHHFLQRYTPIVRPGRIAI